MSLPSDLAAAVARAGADATAEPRTLQDALRLAIAGRLGYVGRDADHAGWAVDLLSPDRQRFHGRTQEEALAWCLVQPKVEELGTG